ncbi:MAG: SDR family NAD(P)-dependent oxidoreductase [Anaerolineales bacterium]|nr:SDR family NAD(P)-dependent oxidoreductase [Anaerolineales bacterium]
MSEQSTPIKRPLEPQKRAIVIGASSGIGAALARRLVTEGYEVALLARREAALTAVADGLNAICPGSAHAYVHDVTDTAVIPGLFQTITRDLGGLDLIAYVAGIQPDVALDEYNFAKDEAMVRTNLLGAMAWLNEAAVRFARAGGGHILGVSSIAGDRGRIGFPAYHASKAGLNTYLESLRNRLTRQGVAVTTIKPGFVDTVLIANAPKTFWVISPEDAAAQIYRAVRRRRQTVYVPLRWTLVGLVIRHIPSFIFRRLNF